MEGEIILKDDMKFMIYDEEIGIKIKDDYIYIVSTDIEEKLAYSFCYIF